MKKIKFSEKLMAIMSYIFLIGFLINISSNKTSFVRFHMKKGNTLNIVLLIWLIVIVVLYRILYLLTFFSNTTLNIIKMILYIINFLILLLVFSYQIYSIVKILKKEN